ncbi:MAG TPA: glutaredoxin family protein [Dehalococcoidia bacterium]|nr:glutaredoxin family protein [Dehalococcoidia bacterium]
MSSAVRLRLLTRPDCGLCKEMARDLTKLGLAFDTIDIEGDPRLLERFGEAIPVLMDGDREIARAPQTAESLRRALAREGLLPAGR